MVCLNPMKFPYLSIFEKFIKILTKQTWPTLLIENLSPELLVLISFNGLQCIHAAVQRFIVNFTSSV